MLAIIAGLLSLAGIKAGVVLGLYALFDSMIFATLYSLINKVNWFRGLLMWLLFNVVPSITLIFVVALL